MSDLLTAARDTIRVYDHGTLEELRGSVLLLRKAVAQATNALPVEGTDIRDSDGARMGERAR